MIKRKRRTKDFHKDFKLQPIISLTVVRAGRWVYYTFMVRAGRWVYYTFLLALYRFYSSPSFRVHLSTYML